ncbi:uncharacterized protein BP5553_07336 [Venustampulla echinocandica]|uniref:Uncharacterized protein n=1 Tax=Venustampulla echinocandica TaxID=2656787 RepID=A0A370TJ71_9HELO|nr:uncharacterized protein BP5553_07336 [Venustampulla echinocandica]RDL35405.1 hypothetical protein BP5553_07336 [Venustampulla echinocandica]
MGGVGVSKPEVEANFPEQNPPDQKPPDQSPPEQNEQLPTDGDDDPTRIRRDLPREIFTAAWKLAEGAEGPNLPHHNTVFREVLVYYIHKKNYKKGIFKNMVSSDAKKVDLFKVLPILIESPETSMKEKLSFIQCLRWSFVHAEKLFVPDMADVWAPIDDLIDLMEDDILAQTSEGRTQRTIRTNSMLTEKAEETPAEPKCKGTPWSEILAGIYLSARNDPARDYNPPPMVQIIGQDDAVRATIVFRTDGSAEFTKGGTHGLPPGAPESYIEKWRTEKLKFGRMQMDGTWGEWGSFPEIDCSRERRPKTKDLGDEVS